LQPSKTPKAATSTAAFSKITPSNSSTAGATFSIRKTPETAYYEKPNRNRQPQDRLVYNKETLGFRLDSTSQIAVFNGSRTSAKPINDFCDYLRALMSAVLNVQDNLHLHSDDWNRTVYIDTLGVGTVDFNIPDDRKQALLASGSSGTIIYLSWYDRKFCKRSRVANYLNLNPG
jgi:NTE family protein